MPQAVRARLHQQTPFDERLTFVPHRRLHSAPVGISYMPVLNPEHRGEPKNQAAPRVHYAGAA